MRTAPRLEDFDPPSFDPFAAMEEWLGGESVEDPYPELSRLRSIGPVHKIDMRTHFNTPPDLLLEGLEKYAVFGYHEVRTVYDTPAVYSSSVLDRTLATYFGRTVTSMDAPEHTKYRRIFMRAFLPHVVAKWGETLIKPVIDAQIDTFAHRGRAELVSEFTRPYPFEFLYRHLELPRDQMEVFHRLTVGCPLGSLNPERSTEAKNKLAAYYLYRIEKARAQPGDDLISALVQAEVEGARLPDDAIVSFLRNLVGAASDTTFRSTGSLLAGLLTHPNQLEDIRRDRSLVPVAIEELLRWEAPVTFMQRITLCDAELGGVHIPKGSLVEPWNGAANRDPAIFADPDRYDLHRPRLKHYAFSSGPHVCIGQHLAKLEMTYALNALLDRLPRLRLDPDMPPPKVVGINLRSPTTIHVRFD